MMKFLRTIRFDDSDARVFDMAAPGDEWAISGAFEFADLEDAALRGRTRQAFANGFLGLPSFGRSTFAAVADMDEGTHDELIGVLSRHLEDAYGAPDAHAAREAARAELAFVADLCGARPLNTVFTVRRVLEQGAIREEFREISPPGERPHAKIWEIQDDGA